MYLNNVCAGRILYVSLHYFIFENTGIDIVWSLNKVVNVFDWLGTPDGLVGKDIKCSIFHVQVAFRVNRYEIENVLENASRVAKRGYSNIYERGNETVRLIARIVDL